MTYLINNDPCRIAKRNVTWPPLLLSGYLELNPNHHLHTPTLFLFKCFFCFFVFLNLYDSPAVIWKVTDAVWRLRDCQLLPPPWPVFPPESSGTSCGLQGCHSVVNSAVSRYLYVHCPGACNYFWVVLNVKLKTHSHWKEHIFATTPPPPPSSPRKKKKKASERDTKHEFESIILQGL